MPYITRKVPYYEVLDEEGLATIEHNADTLRMQGDLTRSSVADDAAVPLVSSITTTPAGIRTDVNLCTPAVR